MPYEGPPLTGDEPKEPPVEPKEPEVIKVDDLPEAIRGKTPEEINLYITGLEAKDSARSKEVADLATSVAELKGKVDRPTLPLEPATPEEPFDANAAVLDDAAGTIRKVVTDDFGGIIGNLQEQASEVGYLRAEKRFEDFSDHEEDVRGVLKKFNAPPTVENIEMAYWNVKGPKMASEKEKTPKEPQTVPPSAPVVEPVKPAELTPLEREVAGEMGMTDEEYLKAKDSPSLVIMDVPTATGAK